MIHSILSHLSADYPWKDRLHYFESIGSTNDYLKDLARQGAPHGAVCIAARQTAGHGRMGRTFHSPGGLGIYLSILLRPNCAPTQLMHLTCAAAVAMCNAVENASGLRPGIKWTNDLVWGRKKLGGILTEMGLSPKGTVDWCLIGIGINCCHKQEDFPEELRSIATSLDQVTGFHTEPAQLAAAMLEALAAMDERLLTDKANLLDQYRLDCVTVGQEISVVRGNEVRHGTALSIDDEGALVVSYGDGSTETVNSGEVSIRGMYGYV